MINLYPMDFEEFLMAMGEDLLINLIKESYLNNKPIQSRFMKSLATL